MALLIKKVKPDNYDYALMKRLFDIFISFSVLLVLFPIIIFIVLLVKSKLGSPIFFRQARPGVNGKIFTMIKFRSMLDSVDIMGGRLQDSKRLTSFGRFFRSTSLDELPELWNVLKGDMSIVGPRPLLVEYLPLYSTQQARRHEVKPGITGWAQVNGRNAISWDEKFYLDVWYVDNRSIWLDIRILWLTVKKVIMRDGVNQSDQFTMDKFKGNL
jgi:lipopolysaccharide/colanic/teichoic acid biosynthesis glycosyltransferase